MLFNFSVVFVTFWFMEFMAWFTHKFVMHGLLWYLHKDHHQVEPGFFEKNDSFFLIFAIPSAYCYVTGLMYNDYRLYIGIGISLYGFAYFIIHEIIIHQRFKLWSRLDNRYVKAIRRAHKIHHKYLGKEDGENFGMLIFPLKYWKNPNSTN
ncbi:MAG: sterol desaturase family protein [Bacteroidia bacterium]